MRSVSFARAILAALAVTGIAGTAAAQGRSVPTFVPEAGWAKFPPPSYPQVKAVAGTVPYASSPPSIVKPNRFALGVKASVAGPIARQILVRYFNKKP